MSGAHGYIQNYWAMAKNYVTNVWVINTDVPLVPFNLENISRVTPYEHLPSEHSAVLEVYANAFVVGGYIPCVRTPSCHWLGKQLGRTQQRRQQHCIFYCCFCCFRGLGVV
eukprot:TRINITY_DN6952_c0_g1_i1.p1 TRINITY_DN6952_c0_g1~~TRINITY_DN6952_c0_g1_i1.p1  ORF type:complete len:111 (+),score=3.09 TRINITY_DN6952_c0_g1_i1:159-491(+)